MTNSEQPDSSSEPWDQIIEPRSSLISLRLREVWSYRDLLLLFTYRDIVSFYKQTILGPLWFFIQPLLTTLVYVLVFGKIAKLSSDGTPQILFYMSGVVFWNYFSECFNKTATVFRDNAPLFGKVYFPRLIIPFSIVVSNLIRFAIQFGLFALFLAYYVSDGAISPNRYALLLPLSVSLMATLGLAMGMIFSALTTKYRDLIFLMQFGVQLLMYATPVIYPSSQVPSGIASVLAWNPLSPVFELTRLGFLGEGTVSAGDVAYSVAFSMVALLVSIVIFNRVEKTFMDSV